MRSKGGQEGVFAGRSRLSTWRANTRGASTAASAPRFGPSLCHSVKIGPLNPCQGDIQTTAVSRRGIERAVGDSGIYSKLRN
jgi:hypothetical protein